MSPDKGTVLVVDDNPLIREVLARHLQARGYYVVMAADGSGGNEGRRF